MVLVLSSTKPVFFFLLGFDDVASLIICVLKFKKVIMYLNLVMFFRKNV